MALRIGLGGQSLRVLHVLSGDLWGGAEAQTLLQVAAVRKLGVDAQVLFFNDGEALHRFREGGIPCHLVSESEGKWRWLRASLQKIGSAAPHLLISNGYKEATVAAITAVTRPLPLIMTFHGATEMLPGWKGWKLRWFQRWERLLARYVSDRIVVISEALGAELCLSSLPNTRVIRNVCEHPSEVKPLSSIRHPAVAIVGRLVPVKNISTSIQAISHLSDVHLYIAGEGPERENLENLVQNLNMAERVHFLGFCESGRSVIAAVDLLLITSHSEGIPTVLLEGIAAGRVIVSSDLPGIREVLAHFPRYPCILVPPGDPRTAAEAVATLLQERPVDVDPAPLRFFSPEYAAEKHLALYREIVEEME